MKERENPSRDPWRAWLGVLMLFLTGLVGGMWISSYLVGVERYRSAWSADDGSVSEEARWLVSNHGSIGFAWRSQEGEQGGITMPPEESVWKDFESSPSALNNVHPEGFLAWHWIHYEATEFTMMGSMRTGYGHLYVPYWMPFLANGLTGCLVLGCLRRRARKQLQTDFRSASELATGEESLSRLAGDSRPARREAGSSSELA